MKTIQINLFIWALWRASGGSVVVDFVFIITTIVGVCNQVIVLCFVVRYYVHFLVLQLS